MIQRADRLAARLEMGAGALAAAGQGVRAAAPTS